MTDRDAELDAVLIGGREPVTITIVDYDPAWRDRFIALKQQIAAALGSVAVRIEHIGSTSVRGLAAKPIVDVLLVVRTVDDEATYVPTLEQAGFLLRVREVGHRMLRTPSRDVHLHVYDWDSPEIDAYLDLRDWLRVNSDDRENYAAVKRELAKQKWTDMNHYADDKSDMISEILARARAWRGRLGTTSNRLIADTSFDLTQVTAEVRSTVTELLAATLRSPEFTDEDIRIYIGCTRPELVRAADAWRDADAMPLPEADDVWLVVASATLLISWRDWVPETPASDRIQQAFAELEEPIHGLRAELVKRGSSRLG
jgi:GrpB-like predicted nucleotidyltransferase (UPF0157 family)